MGLVGKRNPDGSAHTFLTTASWPHPSIEILKLQTFFIGGKGEAELCTPILETGVKSDYTDRVYECPSETLRERLDQEVERTMRAVGNVLAKTERETSCR